ncbi:MAG: hypothetical protein AAGK05_18325 [Pseudomonadota bacterium]
MIRFQDILNLNPPQWLIDLSNFDPLIDPELEPCTAQEIIEMKEDTFFKNKLANEGIYAWLHVSKSAPNLFKIALPYFLAFPTTWLAETGFSHVVNILSRKRSQLNIEHRGLLRLALNQSLDLDIDQLVKKHQDQGSH